MTMTMSPQGAGDGDGPMSDLAHEAFRGLATYLNETTIDKYGDSGCAKDYPTYDYTVLSVAIMTLSLLLIVEIALHNLDHLAEGHRFTQAVLTSLYRELAVLGVVESGVFLLNTYYTALDTNAYYIFSKVHFAFFFTAVMNALQAVLLAFLSRRISHNMWVRTEELEIYHYIALRQEFETVDNKVLFLSERHNGDSSTLTKWKHFFVEIYHNIRYPALKRKHRQLLVQVRFHELRKHFLKANNLPEKFKLSDYLAKAELEVFIQMLKISTMAWLCLMGAFLLLYFIFGMVAAVTEDPYKVTEAMAAVYIGYNIAFVLITLAMMYKMKSIFAKIISMKFIDFKQNNEKSDTQDDDSNTSGMQASKEVAATVRSISTIPGADRRQLDLFWGGDPYYLIGCFQFMQFGYAIAGAILLAFWTVIDVEYSTINPFSLIAAVVICYTLFVLTLAQTLPRYTLCTSLGQLVNKQLLSQALARYKLMETQRKRRIQMERIQSKKEADKAAARLQVNKASRPTLTRAGLVSTDTAGYESDSASEGPDSVRRAQLSALVGMDTKDLTKFLPAANPPVTRRDRRVRMKSLSDGVSVMRATFSASSGMSDAAHDLVDVQKIDTVAEKDFKDEDDITASAAFQKAKSRRTRNRKKSQSENVALMRSPPSSLFGGADGTNPSEEEKIEIDESSKKKTEINASSKKKRRGSLNGALPSLMEGIPSRNVPALNIDIPVGRNGSISNIPNGGTFTTASLPLHVVDDASDKSSALTDLKEVDGEDDDADTVDSIESQSAHSNDDEDVPDAVFTESYRSELQQRQESLPDKLRKYYLSSTFKFFSNVFGTMACGFFVGMRVEVLLQETGALYDGGDTWDWNRESLFWLEFSWLIGFLIESFIVLVLFVPTFSTLRSSNQIVWVAYFNLIITALCLSILIASEVMRCRAEDDCAQFGDRIGEGIGRIEPFTSLVALRPLRWLFGGKVSSWASRNKVVGRQSTRFAKEKIIETHGHHNGHGVEYAELVEIWKSAVGAHPEIVEKYGEFSGELLQTMLGINVIEEEDEPTEPEKEKPKHISRRGFFNPSTRHLLGNKDKLGSNGGSDAEIVEDVHVQTQNNLESPCMTLSKKYARLDAGAQGVILAGKIGQPVRARIGSMDIPGAEMEDSLRSNTCAVSNNIADQVAAVAPHRVEFILDQKEVLEEARDTEAADEDVQYPLSSFVNPNAKLIRRMRRCERRLPPMLDKWAVVDIVLTNYEMVYFDAGGVDFENDDKTSSDPMQHSVLEALIATNGGKGLRLRDVTVGRKIVGHLELSRLDTIQVERIIPDPRSGEDASNHDSSRSTQLMSNGANAVSKDEYWKAPVANQNVLQTVISSYNAEEMQGRWEAAVEDRLKIHSEQGTLYLRFFVDLLQSERERSDIGFKNDDTIAKDDALLWCQTIAHLCGTEQLRQKLPHYGESEGDEELRDFLITRNRAAIDDNGKSPKIVFNQFLNRIQSTANKTTHTRSKSTSDFFSLHSSRHLSTTKSSRNLNNGSVEYDLSNSNRVSTDGSQSSKRNTVTFEDEHDIGPSQ
eukprot:CAMPEP_0198292428 /NCGR_PEP_ID=MMETSP1449-20131203/11992_1 /TAXON_ID=420275 /ORGANISM="Attheya septentrionalis, Strain CCMP2084" /LENGTH=1551 /DNA_ID=CAMNT_0043991461 /DNA_START=169 /DNA_END=4821 /DNA_ORIENTATION=+